MTDFSISAVKIIKQSYKSFLIFFLISLPVFAQANGKNFGVSFNLNYTTTSKLFLQPNAVDQFIRNNHENLDGITSYSVEVRYQISESFIIGLGSEIIKKTFDSSINLGGISAKMIDGYKMIPVELSGYYLIPFSSDQFKFFMGGGFGLYFGEQIRELGDVTISNDTRKTGYGIHVGVGMDFVFTDYLAVRGQMRFRDPEFEMTSSYSSDKANYENENYNLKTESFSSKVNIDGITFTIGVVFSF